MEAGNIGMRAGNLRMRVGNIGMEAANSGMRLGNLGMEPPDSSLRVGNPGMRGGDQEQHGGAADGSLVMGEGAAAGDLAPNPALWAGPKASLLQAAGRCMRQQPGRRTRLA